MRAISVGTIRDDSAHLGALLGDCWGDGSLVRSGASLSRFSPSAGLRLQAIRPELVAVWNSEIPVSLNDGSLWAGRGWSTSASAGLMGSYRRLRFTFAPRLNTSQNRAFGILPSGREDRSHFASPWRSAQQSGDFPIRFGTERYVTIDPGETMLEARLGSVGLGVTSAAAWWGPGIRNALVLSNNGGGVPQAYLRTTSPIPTSFGLVEAYWLVGYLVESPFFDRDSRNDVRALSAASIVLRTAADSGLRVGASRSVYSSMRQLWRLPEHAADVLMIWYPRDSTGTTGPQSEQITSLFAKWAIPEAGVAAHLEWAKVTFPRSLRDLLVDPQEGQGFTIGLEWARHFTPVTTLRLQTEFSSLEQMPPAVGAETQEFYTSDVVPQGYSYRGQSIGAAIGPGSSSQFVGSTLYHGPVQVALSLGRIRWEQDAYYREPSQGRLTYMAHDVSYFMGLSGVLDSKWGQAELGWTRTLRMNFLFQTSNPYGFGTEFDVWNHTIALRLTPHAQPLAK